MNIIIWANELLSGYIQQEIYKSLAVKEIKKLNITSILPSYNIQEYYSEFKTTPPDYIFIHADESVLNNEWYGYDILSTIIENIDLTKSVPNIFFVTFFLRKSLLNVMKGYRYFIIQGFSHITIPDFNVDFSQKYSKEHFELIKYKSLNDQGILDTICHNLSNLLNNDNIKNIREVWYKLKNDILNIQNILTIDTIKYVNSFHFKNEITLEETKSALANILLKIQTGTDFKSSNALTYKLPHKILIIEDNLEFLEWLKQEYEKYFNSVQIQLVKNESDKNLILKKIINYNIVITDLIFEDDDSFLLPFSGFDIIRELKNIHLHIIFRVITSWSRSYIGRILDIPISHVFSKNMNKLALSELIYNDLDALKIEFNAKQDEKYRITNWGPSHGIFEIPKFKYLIFQIKEKNYQFYIEKYWEPAFKLADKFIINDLEINDFEWNPELFAPKTKDTFKKNPEKIDMKFIDSKLKFIFANRLFVFSYALINDCDSYNADFLKINVKDYSSKKCFRSEFEIDTKNYLNTKLGISARELSGEEYIIINFINLFPEEKKWLFENIISKKEDLNINTYYDVLVNWINTCKDKSPESFISLFQELKFSNQMDWSIDKINQLLNYVISNKKYENVLEILYNCYEISPDDEKSLPLSTLRLIDKIFSRPLN